MPSNSNERTRFDRSTSLLAVFGSVPGGYAAPASAESKFADWWGFGCHASLDDELDRPVSVGGERVQVVAGVAGEHRRQRRQGGRGEAEALASAVAALF
jgi:hypothetical protein